MKPFYKIIIPKEELKQSRTCIQCDGSGETTFSGTYTTQRVCDVCNGKGYVSLNVIKQAEKDLASLQTPKQETIEEAAEKIGKELDYSEFDYTSFKLGAKWQAERSYSEEEVWELVNKLNETLNIGSELTLEQWFEQYKKK